MLCLAGRPQPRLLPHLPEGAGQPVECPSVRPLLLRRMHQVRSKNHPLFYFFSLDRDSQKTMVPPESDCVPCLLIRKDISTNFLPSWLYRPCIAYLYTVRHISLLKGTVLRGRFQKCWLKLTYLGLNKGRSWFLNFYVPETHIMDFIRCCWFLKSPEDCCCWGGGGFYSYIVHILCPCWWCLGSSNGT